MSRSTDVDRYEFHVRGHLSDGILAAFVDFDVTRLDGETLFTGQMLDQSALFGVLDRIESLGIQLIEVRRAPGASRRRRT